jgi:hypothetical protein
MVASNETAWLGRLFLTYGDRLNADLLDFINA